MRIRPTTAFAVLAVSGSLFAQPPGIRTSRALPGGPPAQETPTFRVQVDAIEIDAVVTDALGAPVTDLTAGDFELLEDGRPQVISSFSVVNIPIERRDRPRPLLPAIEPDVQANDAGDGRLYVIALDEMSSAQALRTRHFLRRFIEQYFAANDVAAVAYLGRAWGAKAQDLTGNRRLLLESIDTFTGSPDPPGGSTATPPPQAGFQSAGDTAKLAQGRDLERNLVVRRGMASLKQLSEFTATIRGRRKAMLVFSEGFALDIFRVLSYRGGVLSLPEEDLHAAITAATRGNVTVYPIDPRGLTVDGGLAENSASPATDPAARMDAAIARSDQRMGMRAIAEATGGFAVVESNRFDAAFERIVRENSAYYVLGYSSTNDRADGRFRKLEVRVKRPGLQVRARSGYVAPLRRPRPDNGQAPATLSAETATALGSALAMSGVPLRLFAAPYKRSGREATIVIATEITDVKTLGLVEKGGEFSGTLEVAHVATDGGSRRVLPGDRITTRLALKPGTYERAVTGGMRVLSEMRLQPGRYQIRVAAGNQAGRAGSVVYDLDVPDFTESPLTMSGVSIASEELADVTTIQAREPTKTPLPAPITAAREFRAGDRLMVFAEFYENVRNAPPHTLDLKAELRGPDGQVRASESDRRSSSDEENRAGYGFSATLPLDDIEPGVYTIHVEARPTLGAMPAVSRDIPIRVTD